MVKVTPEMLLDAYRAGIFPMAEDRRAAELHWFDPARRGILPIAGLHVPRRLARTILKKPYRVTFDRDFERVIRNCADVRDTTWINDDIIALYTALHKQGHAHSVEAWDGRVLAGGVYGISIGGAFFGESMFSVRTDASKVALVHLVARLWRRGYELFDTQYVNEHLKQFGVQEIPRGEYRRLLRKALQKQADFNAQSPPLGRSSLAGLPSPLPSVSPSPSSKEPGNCSRGGTVGLAAGALTAGGAAGLGAAAAGVSVAGLAAGESVAGLGDLPGATRSDALPGAAPSTKPISSLLPDKGAASGEPLGAVSDENSSDLDVVAFLHSITQTS